jgi:phosphoglycolate phosphatase-like HAD superfamily hydrolase
MLLLFDIDGTLLGAATGAHRDALHAGILAVHGVDVAGLGHAIRPAGRTDGEIARTLLLAAGVPAGRIDEGAQEVHERCCRAYDDLCPTSLADRVLPGVEQLLRWVAGRDGVRLSLVTGNYESVARLKLARAGIGHYFAPGQGGFGSDAENRSALPRIARGRAGRNGVPYPRDQTIVIGDTPRDIACARADGLRCLAVATGPFHVDELRDADAVAADAHDLRELVAGAL